MKTQFSIPDVGCRVAITVAFPSYVIGTATVNKTTITGVVEKATKFTPPNFVRIVTDFDSPVRVREIPLERITNSNMQMGVSHKKLKFKTILEPGQLKAVAALNTW